MWNNSKIILKIKPLGIYSGEKQRANYTFFYTFHTLDVFLNKIL